MFREIHHRAPGNYDPDEASRKYDFKSDDVSKTVQSQRDEADINVIVRRFGVTGVLPQAAVPPTYGDFSGVSDYRTALHLIKAADASFMSLPAAVRRQFNNDSGAFLAAIEAGEIPMADMVKYGLVEAPPPAPPIRAVEPTAAPSPAPDPEPVPAPVPAPKPASRGGAKS